MESRFYLEQFLKTYCNESACFRKLKELRFPSGIECDNCWKITPHYKLKKRKAYGCKICLRQTYPLAGTIFEKSRTKLKLWFYAIFKMVNTRCGISAKSLQREIGVTYKTAWRMLMQIRKLMSEDIGILKGLVEVDETWVGGKDWFKGKKWWSNYKESKKQIVFGMVERRGRVKTVIVPDVYTPTLFKEIQAHIDPKAWIISDGHYGYRDLTKKGYKHSVVNHTLQYVNSKNPQVYTQTIEGFWGLMKRGITGVYRHVSKQHLQKYCDEFAFRYNHRKNQYMMFNQVLKRI